MTFIVRIVVDEKGEIARDMEQVPDRAERTDRIDRRQWPATHTPQRRALMTVKRIALVVLIVGFLINLFAGPGSASGPGLTGAWNVTIVLDGGAILCTTPSLDSADGGVVAQGCNVNVSPGYGQWR